MIKSVEQPSGATASYWRIAASHVYYGRDSALVELEGYVDAKARKAGKTPLVPLVQVSVVGSDEAVANAKGDVRSALYPLVTSTYAPLEGAESDAQ